MLNVSNNYGLNPVNKINFGLNKNHHRYHNITIPIGTNDVLVSADECLEAYNKGGMLIHIQDKKPVISSQKANEFVANMQIASNLNINGDKLNLYDSLADYTDQEVTSEFTEMRKNQHGELEEVSRYELADKSVIDKELYDFSRYLTTVKPCHRGFWAKKYFMGKTNRINIGNNTFIIGNMYVTLTTNIIDSKGNIVGKRYRQDGSVSNVLKSGDKKGIHYNSDGTITDKSAPKERIFFD